MEQNVAYMVQTIEADDANAFVRNRFFISEEKAQGFFNAEVESIKRAYDVESEGCVECEGYAEFSWYLEEGYSDNRVEVRIEQIVIEQ